MNTILIEDDPMWQSKIQVMLNDIGITILGTASNTLETTELLNKHNPDFIVADILLQHEVVFKAFEYNKNSYLIPTIFITQSDKEIHYKQAKLFDKHLYIVKPIHKLTLKSAINTICPNYQTKIAAVNKTLSIVGRFNEKIEIPIHNIIYIQQENNYCNIYTTQKRITLKKSLTNLMLNLDNNFLRIHKTYCVNVNCITKFNMGLLSLTIANKELPIGRINRLKVKEYISQTSNLAALN